MITTHWRSTLTGLCVLISWLVTNGDSFGVVHIALSSALAWLVWELIVRWMRWEGLE